jgi:hypothetical protein
MEQYSREEFNQHAKAFPCVSENTPDRDEQIGIVRLRVATWETPHAIRAANAGRLYRGMFIDRSWKKTWKSNSKPTFWASAPNEPPRAAGRYSNT